MRRKWLALGAVFVGLVIGMTGCMRAGDPGADSPHERATATPIPVNKPTIPADLPLNADGIPMLQVYNLSTEKTSEMDVETYLAGVLAGEMKNNWPIEALKAQAILARTFVLHFVDTKDSKYKGADISTDVGEAQAYNASLINDTIRQAVAETKGQVMSYEGQLPTVWFHAHAGGKTERPSAALEYDKGDPTYIQPVESPDSEDAPDDVKQWTATFTANEVKKACADAGVSTGTVTSVEVGETGDSGRAITLIVNGKSVSAPSLRIQLGANRLKSTLIREIRVDDGAITFTGSGYGHGVGMSQWGAYGMAKDGKTADDIVSHYFNDIAIVTLW